MANNSTESVMRIISRFDETRAKTTEDRTAMSRGFLVVDENAQKLAAVLRKLGLRVVVPRPGTSDQQIKEDLLGGRILVTKNAKDFIYDASAFEYGIISLDDLAFIDSSEEPGQNTTVQLIHRAIIDHSLWSKTRGFILVLKEDGRHVYRNLHD